MKKRRLFLISLTGLLFIVSGITFGIFKSSNTNTEPPLVVIRIDDIQDFAFREAQLFLLNESMIHQTSLSLAVITGMFGEDTEIVQKVSLAANLGSEVAVHGWEHEDLTNLSFKEQTALLFQAKNRLKGVLDYDVSVLVPPMFSFNENTTSAMQVEGYNIISTLSDYMEPDLTSEILSLPGTVELADFSNGSWKLKSIGTLEIEISKSIQKYGFAVIVTHPQEFITDKMLNPVNTEIFTALLETLKENYTVTTLERLGEIQTTGTGN